MQVKGTLKLTSLAAAALGVAVIGAMAPAVLAQSVQQIPREFYTFTYGSPLGATIRDVTDADVTRAKLASATGAVLDSVQEAGPAGRAGFKSGDVVLSFDAENVRSARHLQRLIEETADGREVAVTVMRAGERVTLKMKMESRGQRSFGPLNNFGDLSGMQHFYTPDLTRFQEEFRMNVPEFRMNLPEFRMNAPEFYFRDAAGRFSMFSDGRLRLGIGVQELTTQLGEYFGTPAGVLVTEVDDNSSGKTAGLRAGDVITKVNDQAVRSTQDLRRLLGNASGEIGLTVMRDRKEQTLKVKLQDEALETPGRTIRRR